MYFWNLHTSWWLPKRGRRLLGDQLNMENLSINIQPDMKTTIWRFKKIETKYEHKGCLCIFNEIYIYIYIYIYMCVCVCVCVCVWWTKYEKANRNIAFVLLFFVGSQIISTIDHCQKTFIYLLSGHLILSSPFWRYMLSMSEMCLNVKFKLLCRWLDYADCISSIAIWSPTIRVPRIKHYSGDCEVSFHCNDSSVQLDREFMAIEGFEFYLWVKKKDLLKNE